MELARVYLRLEGFEVDRRCERPRLDAVAVDMQLGGDTEAVGIEVEHLAAPSPRVHIGIADSMPSICGWMRRYSL